MEEVEEKSSRQKLKELGFSAIVLWQMSDEECDRILKSVIFI